MNSHDVKVICQDAGVDICGITSIDRFVDVPGDHHPRDLLPGCQSVIVLACQFPYPDEGFSPDTYTAARNMMDTRMNEIATTVCNKMQSLSSKTIIKKTWEMGSWDSDGRYRDTLSLKHAGMLAGLGTIGKNTLLVNKQYGNMIWLSAVITTEAFDPDPLASYNGCIDGCSACIEACPVMAIDGEMKNQMTCFSHAYTEKEGKEHIICWKCRVACPHYLGIPD